MSKYIDADKLKAEIERRREKCADIAADERNDEVAEYYYGKEVAHDEISSLVTSLQQEQPPRDYDEAYLNECIAKASKTWKGVDADKYLDEVRGREQEQPELVKGKFVFPNFLYARTVDNKTIDVSYAPQSLDAVEYIKNEPTE